MGSLSNSVRPANRWMCLPFVMALALFASLAAFHSMAAVPSECCGVVTRPDGSEPPGLV